MSDFVLPILIVCSVAAIACLAAARIYRPIERHFEWKRWATNPGYHYFGRQLPTEFPADLLADIVFFVDVRNCVLRTRHGRRYLAFDLDRNQWSRNPRWMTVVAVQGQITAANPWRHADDAHALQGNGWLVLFPEPTLMAQKPWLWRLMDNLPPRQRLIEAEAVLHLWRAVTATVAPQELT